MLRRMVKCSVALLLVLCMAACGNGGEEPSRPAGSASAEDGGSLEGSGASGSGSEDGSTGAGEGSEDGRTGAESGSEESNSASGSETTPAFSIQRFELPDNEAMAFVRDVKIGWSLGNTFDAVDCTWLSDELDYESGWNGTKTTERHVEMLKEAGFRAIRIPVSWHNHLTDEKNYAISQPWLDRVTEIVDCCLENDLYVIINIHHDNSTEFLYPSSPYLEQSVAYVTAIWTQLSEHFKDYDEHLIFAGMNEPRLVGHANEWWIDANSEDCKDAISCINVLNQAFVDTVRASGGNNVSRYLLCPGYDASPDGALNDGFALPTDPAGDQNRIIVSVHAYMPYGFALESGGTPKWSSANNVDVSNVTWFLDKLYAKYVSKGIPVIIDEFGAVDRSNTEARVDYASYYVAAARARGITCFWWDNGALEGDGELLGLLNRATYEWVFPEIVEGMMQYAE